MKIVRSSKCTTKWMTAEKRSTLRRVLEEYGRVVNLFIDHFWEMDSPPIKAELLKPIVDLPETWLTARLRKVAAREALDLISSSRSSCKVRREEMQEEENLRFRQGKFNQCHKLRRKLETLVPTIPHHSGRTMSVSTTIANLRDPEDTMEFDAWLEIRCVGDGVSIDIPIRFHRRFKKLEARGRQMQAYVISLDWVQFAFEIETGPKREGKMVVGIDTGIKHLAALSTGEMLGSDIEPIIERIKRCKHGSKGQQRARMALRQRIDEVARDITAREDLDIVVVERLAGIGKKTKVRRRLTKDMRRSIGAWNYRYWLNRLKWRTEDDRVGFRSVPAWNTSNTCPCCGDSDRGNRPSQDVFRCRSCGHTGRADTIAAENIERRFLSGKYGTGCKPLRLGLA
jgi:hypothetical protein